MADTVQYLMEQMIPELEDLEKKGYFSRAEIKKIVQKRQNFEYLLKRRTALKEDFYRYIDFEAKLEELRQVRKRKLGLKGKKSLAEVAIVRRIHFIYERAGRKFRSDLGLWMRWIDTCKKYKSHKQLSKVITKALQRHSTVPELWIEAAQGEFENHNDIAAARSLMQQGIRMCKKDETIWVQYYQLELLYALKLRLRRKILGLDDLAAAGDDGESQEESLAAARVVMQGGIARIVFKNAVATLPECLSFRARFLAVLRNFDSDFVAGLLDQVYDSIRQDFSQVEDAWDLLARRHVDFPSALSAGESKAPEAAGEAAAAGGWDAGSHEQVCAVYEEGLTSAPSARMYQLYSVYLCGVLDRSMGAGEAALQGTVAVAAQLFGLLQRAHDAARSLPETYITWVDWAETVQQPKMALKAARRGCERFPTDVALWRRRLELELSQNGAGATEALHEVLATFTAALQATRPDQACEVWLMAVDNIPDTSPEFAVLCDRLVVACAQVAKKVPSGGLGQVASRLVEKTRTALGVEAARQLYGRLLAVPGPGGDLFRCAVALELDLLRQGAESSQSPATAGSAARPKASEKRITELFEAAVTAYGGTETDLWIQYAKWLVQCGKGPGKVYWRATKELVDPDSFVQQYREAIGA